VEQCLHRVSQSRNKCEYESRTADSEVWADATSLKLSYRARVSSKDNLHTGTHTLLYHL
jgi:hypothetical protein